MKKLIYLCIGVLILSSCNTEPCQFNVDKTEIMAHVDVPKLDKGLYYCNYGEDMKLSFFDYDIDNIKGGIDEYLLKYEFEKREGVQPNQLRHWDEFPEEFKTLIPEKPDFYIKSAIEHEKDWTLILEKTTGYVWAEVIYLD